MTYSRGIAPFCDLFDVDRSEADAACAFVRRLAGKPCSVLDIGAGVGQTAFALAAQGFEVTALEPDAEMHAVLLARLALRHDLVQTLSPVPRPAAFDLGRRFDVCTCLSVLHLMAGDAERRKLVASARAHLAPGGRLVLEVPVASPVRVRRPLSMVAERRFGDVVFQHFSSLDSRPDGSWTTLWKFTSSLRGEPLDAVTQTYRWRPGSAANVDALLASAGLFATKRYAGFDGEPFIDGESPVLVCVASEPH